MTFPSRRACLLGIACIIVGQASVARCQIQYITNAYYVLYSGHVDSQNIADACEGGLPVQGFSTIHEDILAAIHAFYQRSSRQSGNSYAWIADMCPGLCHENDPRWEQNYESPRVDDNIRISYIAIGKLSGRFREFSSNDPLVTEVL